MVGKTNFIRLVFVGLALLAAGQGYAQDELRKTFFKEADAARAAAEAVNAKLLAPRTWERGLKEYTDAEYALERGRNIETVRSNASDAATLFRDATEKASLAKTALAQVMKSRQDAANARARRQGDGAGFRRDFPADQVKQRGFTRPISPDQADFVARWDGGAGAFKQGAALNGEVQIIDT